MLITSVSSPAIRHEVFAELIIECHMSQIVFARLIVGAEISVPT